MSQAQEPRLWNRSFTILWAGLVQSFLGDAFLTVGLMWLVLESTGSPLAAGTVLVLGGIPRLFGPLAGVVVDRSSKRGLMIGGDLVRGVSLIVVFLLHAAGRSGLWHIYGLVVVLATASLFYDPSLRVILPALVPDARLPAANSILQASESAAAIAGSMLAGVTLAAFGAPLALLIDGISFLLAALALAWVSLPVRLLEHRALGAREVGRDLIRGLRFIFGTREVLALLLVVFVSNLVLSPVNVIFPVYSREILGQGVTAFGFLVSAFAAGFLVGSAVAGVLRWPHTWAILAGLLLMSAGLTSLSFARTLMPALLLTAGLGMVAPIVRVPLVSRLQRSVPQDYQGRVFATLSSFVSLSVPLGAALAGQALTTVPVTWVFRGAAVGLLIVSAIWLEVVLGSRGGRVGPTAGSPP